MVHILVIIYLTLYLGFAFLSLSSSSLVCLYSMSFLSGVQGGSSLFSSSLQFLPCPPPLLSHLGNFQLFPLDSIWLQYHQFEWLYRQFIGIYQENLCSFLTCRFPCWLFNEQDIVHIFYVSVHIYIYSNFKVKGACKPYITERYSMFYPLWFLYFLKHTCWCHGKITNLMKCLDPFFLIGGKKNL